jgi:hypothetical protein
MSEQGTLPRSNEVREAISWLLALSAAYEPKAFGGLVSHSAREPRPIASRVREVLTATERLRAHVVRMHRDVYLVGTLTDRMGEYLAARSANEERRAAELLAQVHEMIERFTGRPLTRGQLAAIENASTRDEKIKHPRDSAAVRAAAKLLGLTERAVYKIRATPKPNALRAVPTWLGASNALKTDRDAQTSVLELVIVDMLGFDQAKLWEVFAVLDLLPDQVPAHLQKLRKLAGRT